MFQFEYCHLAGRLRVRMRGKEHKTSCLMCNKPLVTYQHPSVPGSLRMDQWPATMNSSQALDENMAIELCK
jgi:hypothetical protein